jgi:hypothetical protein
VKQTISGLANLFGDDVWAKICSELIDPTEQPATGLHESLRIVLMGAWSAGRA